MYPQNEWLEKIYSATLKGKRLISKYLEIDVEKMNLDEGEQARKALLAMYIKLVRVYLYIDGSPAFNAERGLYYCEKIKKSKAASIDEKVWAEIQLCNQLRCTNGVEEAIGRLNILEDIRVESVVSTKTLFEFWWVRALCNSQDAKLFKEYTVKAREFYELLPKNEQSILEVDKYVCTGVWFGPLAYRQGIQERWLWNETEAQKLFDESEKVLSQALKDCTTSGVRREVDPLLHLSMLYAFCLKDYDKAMEKLGEAKKTGIGYVAEFAKMIIPRCKIGRGQDPGLLKEMNLKTNQNEQQSWWWAFKIELPLAALGLYKDIYGNKPKTLRKKVLTVVPDDYEKTEFPHGLIPGSLLVVEKKKEVLSLH